MKMQFKRTLITPLDATGAIKSNPVLIPIEFSSNSIEAKQSTKVIDTKGNCCSQKVAFGAKDITGSISGALTTALAMIIAQHLMGKFDTLTDFTITAWEADTVVTEGDIVNHSNGTHSLVCVKSGTTASDEPTITDIGKTITDNTTKWLIVSLLKKGATTTAKLPTPIAVENEFEKEDGTSMYVRYMGVYISKNSVVAKSGEIEMTWTIDVTGANVEDSIEDGFTPLKDITGAKMVKIFDDIFANDELKGGYISTKDGVIMQDYEEFSFDITRKVEKSKGMPKFHNGKFIAPPADVGKDIKAENGKLVAYATEELYGNFKNHESFNADIEMVNGLGGSIKYSFKGILPNYSSVSMEDCLNSKIEPELFVTGDCNDGSAPVEVEVVYPSLVDTTGAIISGGYPI